MNTMTMTLDEFLLARIAEDEEVARAATHQKIGGPSHGAWNADSLHLTDTGLERADRRHIAHFDPERMLADCMAKRRIVELRMTAAYQAERMKNDGPAIAGIFASSLSAYDAVLRSLALPYADHPDYPESTS